MSIQDKSKRDLREIQNRIKTSKLPGLDQVRLIDELIKQLRNG